MNCVVAPLSHLCSLCSLFSLPLALLSKHQSCTVTAVELLGRALDPVECSHPAWGIYRCHTRLVVELLPLEPSQTRDVCLGLAACVCALFCLLEDAVEGLLYVFVARAFTWCLCWVRSKRQPEKSFLWERYFPLACWNSFQQVDKRHLLKISPCFLSFSAKCLHSFHLMFV